MAKTSHLMECLASDVDQLAASEPAKKVRKGAAGRKEMRLPIAGKEPEKKLQRSSLRPGSGVRRSRCERGARLGLFRWEFGNRQCELPRQRAR